MYNVSLQPYPEIGKYKISIKLHRSILLSIITLKIEKVLNARILTLNNLAYFISLNLMPTKEAFTLKGSAVS